MLKKILLPFLFASLTQFVRGELLVKDSKKPLSAICLAENAADSVKFAASELQNYVKAAGLGELPIVTDKTEGHDSPMIYLGDTSRSRQLGLDPEKFTSDMFVAQTSGEDVVIVGKDYAGTPMTSFLNPFRLNETYNSKIKIGAFGDTGTLFGTYYFLERFLGVRWYMPGDLGTVMPSPVAYLEIPEFKTTEHPRFEQRHIFYCFFEVSEDDARWYRRAGFGSPFPVPVSHSFAHFFMKYKDTNPEFFAIINGQFDFGSLSTVGPGNFNLANEAFIAQVIDEADTFFTENPDQMVFPLCPNDGMTKISEDPASQAQVEPQREAEGGKFSNYVWGFIDKVAKGVAKKHPDKLVGCIAYEQYGAPPTNIERLNSNVLVVLCKSRRRNFDPKYEEETDRRIAEWGKKVEHVYGWEYFCDILLNGGWKGYPVFFPGIVQADLKKLVNVSKGEFIEAESWMPGQYASDPGSIKINYPALQHPLLYVTGKLLWNPDLDLAAMLDEYYHLFYGPAEVEMKAFWTNAEKAWMRQKDEIPADFLTTTEAGEMVDLLEKAKTKVGIDSAYHKRIEMILNEFAPATERTGRLSAREKPVHAAAFFKERPDVAKPLDAFSSWAACKPIKLIDTNYVQASPPTHVRIGWDANSLFVSFVCFEPDMHKLVTNVTDPDNGAIWDDDSVELYLMAPGAEDRGAQYIVNARGVLWDGSRDSSQRPDPLWKSGAVVASRILDGQYEVVMQIPWTDLGIDQATAGMNIKANTYRNRQVGQTTRQSSWAPILANSFYAPRNFGTLVLEN